MHLRFYWLEEKPMRRRIGQIGRMRGIHHPCSAFSSQASTTCGICFGKNENDTHGCVQRRCSLGEQRSHPLQNPWLLLPMKTRAVDCYRIKSVEACKMRYSPIDGVWRLFKCYMDRSKVAGTTKVKWYFENTHSSNEVKCRAFEIVERAINREAWHWYHFQATDDVN